MANVILQAPNCDSSTVFNKLQVQQITIPPDLPSILKRYAKAAIRTQPPDLLVWSAAYFKALSSGIPPPVKERIEYPPVIIASGLTPGFLKVLINQVGREEAKVVPKSTVVERWTDICLSKDALDEILNVGGFHKDTIAWLKFVAICAGYLESRLSRTMVLLIELLSTEPEEKVPAVPVKKFLMLYRFLAAMDCGPVDQRRSTTCDVSSLATEVSPVAGHITSIRTPEEDGQVLDEKSVEPTVNKQTIENEIESEVVNNDESKSNQDNLVNEDNQIEIVENNAELFENKMETVDISGIESEGNGSVSEALINAVETIAVEEEKSNVESIVTSESDSSNLEESNGPVAVNLLEEIDVDLKEPEVTKEEHENSAVNSGEGQITEIVEEGEQKNDNLESKSETSIPLDCNEDTKEEEEENVETGDEKAHHQEVTPDTKDVTPISKTEETEEGEETTAATDDVQEEEVSAVLTETENEKKVGSPTYKAEETEREGEETVDSRSVVEEGFHDAIHETEDDTENLPEKTVEDEQKNEKNMNGDSEIKEEELEKDTEESTESVKVGEQTDVSENNKIGEFHEVKRNEDKIEELKNVEDNNESSNVQIETDINESKENDQGSEDKNFGEIPNYLEKVIESADMVSNEDGKKDENEKPLEIEPEKAETEEGSQKEQNEECTENEAEKAETEEASQKEQNKEENEEYPGNEPEKAETEEGSQKEQNKEENEEYPGNEPEKAETEDGSQKEQNKEENEEYSENEPEKAETEEASQKEQNKEEIEEYLGNEPEKAETEEGSQKEENKEEKSSEKAEIEEDIVAGTETNKEQCTGFQEEEEVQKEEISGFAGREAEKSSVAVVEKEETQETEQVTSQGKGGQDKSEYKELANKENYSGEGQMNEGIMGTENDENEKQTPVEDQNDNTGNQIETDQDRVEVQPSENVSLGKEGFDRTEDMETDKFSEENNGKENTSVLEIDSTETEKNAAEDDSKEDREESRSELKSSDDINGLENIESLNVDSIKDLEEKFEEVAKTRDQFVKAEEENDSVVEDSSVNRLNETEATVEDTTGEMQQLSEGTEEKSAVDNDGTNEVIMSGSVKKVDDDETIANELIQVIHTSGNEHINRNEETGEDSDETNIAEEYDDKNDETATKPDNEEEENNGMVSGDDINSEDSTINEKNVIKDKESSEQINDLENSPTDADEKIEGTENINSQPEIDPATGIATSPSNIQEVTDPTENENNSEESKTEQSDNETEEKEDKQSITEEDKSSVVKENSVETQNSFDETEGILQEDVISLQQANLESVPEAKSNLSEKGELNEEAESMDKGNDTIRGEETLDDMLYLVDNYKEDSQSKGDVNDNLTAKIEEVEVDQALNSENESEEDQQRRSDHLKSESSARSGRSRFAGVVKSGAEWSTQPAYYAYVPGIGPPVPEERIGRVEDYLTELSARQAGYVMTANLRHYLCPPLDP